MTEEDEEFNRIEREASLRKAAVLVAITKKEWVGLTNEEAEDIVESCDGVGWNVARAVESKLREKNI